MRNVAGRGGGRRRVFGRQRGRRARPGEHVRVMMLARMGVQRRHGVPSQQEIARRVGADVRRRRRAVRGVRMVRNRVRRLAKVLVLVARRHGRVRVRTRLGQFQAHVSAVHERVEHVRSRRIAGRTVGRRRRGDGRRAS